MVRGASGWLAGLAIIGFIGVIGSIAAPAILRLLPPSPAQVNGVPGRLLQGNDGGRFVIYDFLPRSAYARAPGPPYRIQTDARATHLLVSLGRGDNNEPWVHGGTPDELAQVMPTDQWDWMVVEVTYGNDPSKDEFGWRFTDSVDNDLLSGN